MDGPISTRIRGLAQGPAGPTVLAIGLAVLATPFGAWAITRAAVDGSGQPAFVDPGLAIGMSLLATLVGAVVGGTVGGLVVRRNPTGGMVLALATAWPAALATLPVVPALLGRHYGGVGLCIDSCGPVITSEALGSAISSYLISVMFGATYSVVATVVLLVIAWRLARRRRAVKAALYLAVVIAINAWSMYSGAFAAVALVVGVVVWVAPYWPWHQPVGADDELRGTPAPPGWGATS